MPDFEILRGYRVASSASDIDAVASATSGVALRFAPDDLFVVGDEVPVTAAPFAIVEEEVGFVGMWLTSQQFAAQVAPHIDWLVPVDRPALAQGLVAGVPAKVWLTDDRVLLITNGAYAHELGERIHE